MRKMLGVLVLGMFVLSFGMISATSFGTIVAGTIYAENSGAPVEGAYVEVTCDGNTETTTSSVGGYYEFTLSESVCSGDNEISVFASHPSYGSNVKTGFACSQGCSWDVAIIHVPLVPEFGVVVGMLTMLSAVAVFFVARKD